MSIQTELIHYQIGKKTILSDINITIEPGEFHVLMGKNGAGKSTLFHLLSSDTRPSSGSIYFDGKPIQSLNAKSIAKQRAVLTQNPEINFPLTCLDIVQLGRFPHETSDTENLDIALQSLEIVDLLDKKNQNYNTLSGGEKQRAHFARVLSQIWEEPPRYLLLDEPISSLDLPNQIKVLELCRHLSQKGYGVFMILHDLNLASRYADKITFLSDGKVFASGPPNEVITEEGIQSVFNIEIDVIINDNVNMVLPKLNKIGVSV
ncbi:heme ABC transporter ATP-binding protein [Leptospira brenneri]|nr:heme ABC transporter ATP-binding protein [Leptospira brenneri]PJZ43851.1 heme ABC transporter ATP-binding protein [Leptospira brenneri]